MPELSSPAVSRRQSRRLLAAVLTAVAADYQAVAVIPHCTECAKPCCRLDSLVLELDWQQLKTLWQLTGSRSAFDARLAAGKGPADIRAANGLYYAHRKTCPAYDAAGRSCRVYGQKLKPVGCTDFPVYQDRGHIIADLRCEAVDLDALTSRLADALGPQFRIVRSADADFPFLVSLTGTKNVSANAHAALPQRPT